jgi:hypothetical protein
MEYRRLGMSGAGPWRPSPGRSAGVRADPSTEFPRLSGVDLTGDYSDFPLGDPNFDYSNADLSAVDPLGDDAEIGSVNIDLSNLNSRPASKAATIVEPVPATMRAIPIATIPIATIWAGRRLLAATGSTSHFGAPAISPATNGTQFQEFDKLRASRSFLHRFRSLTGKHQPRPMGEPVHEPDLGR